jgi:hypothetical protein
MKGYWIYHLLHSVVCCRYSNLRTAVCAVKLGRSQKKQCQNLYYYFVHNRFFSSS